MAKNPRRFVAKAEPPSRWTIWDKKARKSWGGAFTHRPDALLDELNGEKRPAYINELLRELQHRGEVK